MIENRDHHDRLIDILLAEELGGESPPDLTARIVARAFPRRRSWLLAVAAAAAIAIVAGLAWVIATRHPYPRPQATGSYELAEGSTVGRGAVLVTNDQPATLALGGYCRIDIHPASSVTIEGAERAEQIALNSGAVTCDVDQSVGTFGVRTDVGTVSVTGTRFVVRLVEQKGVEQMVGKKMVVSVLMGAVLASGAWGTSIIAAGEEKTLPEGGSAVGILAEKGKAAIFVILDGQKSETKFCYGDAMAEAVRKLVGRNLLKLTWQPGDECRKLTSVEMIVHEAKEGEVTGTIVARNMKWPFIDVRPEGGPTERYVPRWIGGNDGGPDKEILAAIDKRRVGDVVKVKWIYVERKNIVAIELIKAAAVEEKPVDRPVEPALKSGTVTGTVTEKGENWIRVKADGGESERYTPRWVNGGLDKEILAKIAKVQAGQKVTVKWIWEERRRVIELNVVE